MTETFGEPFALSVQLPDLIEKVIGFRCFCVERENYVRGGLHFATRPPEPGTIWSIGPCPVKWERRMKARCLRDMYGGTCEHDPDVIPHVDCDCGLYANHRLGDVLPQARSCFAAVAGWGRLAVHATGFRAQYMEVLAIGYELSWQNSQLALLFQVGDMLDVPLVPLNQLELFAAPHGSPVPEELRP